MKIEFCSRNLRPDLSGALFCGAKRSKKKRERRAEKGAQIILKKIFFSAIIFLLLKYYLRFSKKTKF